MVSASGRSVIVFNGEIYNAAELRADLTGHAFRGHSDTEVLLECCERFGVERTLPRLIGMFAFAFYDREARVLTLCRDRLGKKPLYLGSFGEVAFASELKAFHRHPAFSPQIDPVALSGFVRFGYVPHPRSIYGGVGQVPPGGFARVAADGTITQGRYWRADEAATAALTDPFTGDDADGLAELEAILRDAVRRRMVADVPLGAFLSGGIDSSLVIALMQAESDRPVRTFTIGFDVPGFDEAPHARAVARHLGTDHEELYLTAQDAIDEVPRLPEIYDEPFADSSQLPTYLVSRITRRHVTVALSGDGGDESFAGYDRYGQAATVMRLAERAPVVSAAAGLGRALLTAHAAAPARAVLPPVLRARAERWLGRVATAAGGTGLEPTYLQLVQPGSAPEDMLLFPDEHLAPVWTGSLRDRFPEAVARCQMIDTLTYLPDDILTKVDRASMAVSLEVRAPLVDHRVVSFAWRLPPRFKRRDGRSKWALRELLYRHVPRDVVDRPKMGFGVPIDAWLRGPLRDWAEDLLEERRLAADGIFRPKAVRDLWRRHLSGENWCYRLWCVLMFQAWKRRWL
jgi:asparagine synthase (glutamine-hydrolysing)